MTRSLDAEPLWGSGVSLSIVGTYPICWHNWSCPLKYSVSSNRILTICLPNLFFWYDSYIRLHVCPLVSGKFQSHLGISLLVTVSPSYIICLPPKYMLNIFIFLLLLRLRLTVHSLGIWLWVLSYLGVYDMHDVDDFGFCARSEECLLYYWFFMAQLIGAGEF